MKKKLVLSLLFVFILISLLSGYKIIMWYSYNQKTTTIIENINKNIDIKEIPNNDNDDYKFLEINFNKLLEQNNETNGWLKIKNTNIDYPILKHDDNDFYLNHTFDKTYSEAGWIFLDYRNDLDNLSKNNIIYAHSRLDKSMFGSLTNSMKKEWLDNLENHYINVSSLNKNYVFEIFSIYIIDTTDDYLKVEFTSNDEYIDFLNKINARSIEKFNVNLNSEDKILTLSTCYNASKKYVVHAKLLEMKSK